VEGNCFDVTRSNTLVFAEMDFWKPRKNRRESLYLMEVRTVEASVKSANKLGIDDLVVIRY
jgi:hypothetical protein